MYISTLVHIEEIKIAARLYTYVARSFTRGEKKSKLPPQTLLGGDRYPIVRTLTLFFFFLTGLSLDPYILESSKKERNASITGSRYFCEIAWILTF